MKLLQERERAECIVPPPPPPPWKKVLNHFQQHPVGLKTLLNACSTENKIFDDKNNNLQVQRIEEEDNIFPWPKTEKKTHERSRHEKKLKHIMFTPSLHRVQRLCRGLGKFSPPLQQHCYGCRFVAQELVHTSQGMLCFFFFFFFSGEKGACPKYAERATLQPLALQTRFHHLILFVSKNARHYSWSNECDDGSIYFTHRRSEHERFISSWCQCTIKKISHFLSRVEKHCCREISGR